MQNNSERYINPIEVARERLADLIESVRTLEAVIGQVNEQLDTFVPAAVVPEAGKSFASDLHTLEPLPHQRTQDEPSAVIDQAPVSSLDDYRQRVSDAAEAAQQKKSFIEMIEEANAA